MTAVIATEGLGKRYRKKWALAGCTLSIPAGHAVGLVGPNGAGKSTLINLATGMLAPSAGTIEVLGNRPAAGPAQLARVGYVAQDAPLYAGLSVADHLRLGAHLNPGGTGNWRAAGSSGWAWTRGRRPGRCPAGSAPSSRSAWPSRSGRSC